MRHLAALLSITLSATALAHGTLHPAHGGLIQEGRATTVELVVLPSATTVYLTDHGKPVASTGASGDIIVLEGSKKTVLPLQAAAGNTLTAAGGTVSPRTRAIVRLSLPGREAEQLRFAFGQPSH